MKCDVVGGKHIGFGAGVGKMLLKALLLADLYWGGKGEGGNSSGYI